MTQTIQRESKADWGPYRSSCGLLSAMMFWMVDILSLDCEEHDVFKEHDVLKEPLVPSKWNMMFQMITISTLHFLLVLAST
jgi:hypothetical protein